MNNYAYMTNEKIGSICFIFHVPDIMSIKHDASGLKNVHVTRYKMKSQNEVEEFIEFKSFSDKYENFEQHHASDLARDI